jgi:hypothetical protein
MSFDHGLRFFVEPEVSGDLVKVDQIWFFVHKT